MFQLVRLGFFTAPSTIVPSLHRLRACIFQLLTPLASFSYATWSATTFLASYSEPWTCGNFYYKHAFQPVQFEIFTAPSTFVPSLHRQRAYIFKHFTLLASCSYATWSSATILSSCNEPWTCRNFNALIVSITLQPVRLRFFTTPSTIVPSLHWLKASIFKCFKLLASF